MKKYFVLTSILALAACGGGSGGHHGGAIDTPGNIIKPTDTLTAEQRAAAIASNTEITDMNSFVVVGGTNPTVNPNMRTGGVKLSDGGMLYDLEDATFETASLLMNTGLDKGASVKFITKDGKIDKITMDNGTLNIEASRKGDSNEFVGSGFYADPENPADKELVDGLGMTYKSIAKDTDGLGLAYSDFGLVEWGDEGQMEDSHYFAGGYGVKEIKSVKDGMTFSGTADAVVRIGKMGDDIDPAQQDVLHTNTAATLNFNPETQSSTLTAKFSNWYDVTATMNKDGKLASLNFDNGDKDGFYHSEAHDFKWHGKDSFEAAETADEVARTDLCPNCTQTIVRDGFVKYYGDGTNPAEAVGVIRYGDNIGVEIKDTSGNTTGTEAMRFDMGFGATRD